MQKNVTLSAFSIIEVLVGIFIFTLGLVSIYAILASSLSVNERNKNTIIASNLAREQIELLRNIRDTNYAKLQVWNQRDPENNNATDVFEVGNYYTLENSFSGTGFSTHIQSLGSSIPEGVSQLSAMGNNNTGYQLCLNSDNVYTYDCSGGNKPSGFYRYLKIEELIGADGNIIKNAYRVISKVIWYKRGYFEYDIQTIITDWRRI